MKFFTKDKPTQKTRKPYRKPSEDDVERKNQRKEKEKAREKFYKIARENPEVERQWVAKQMGIDLRPPDPDDEAKKSIRSSLIKAAHELINEDEDLKRQWAETMIPDIIGTSEGKRRRREEGPYGGGGFDSSIQELPELLDSLDALKDRLGNKSDKGILGNIFTEDNFGLVLKLLLGMTRGEGTGVDKRTYVVQIDGQTREVSEQEFKELKSQGLIQPVALIGGRKEEDTEPEKPQTKVPDLTEIANSFDLSMIDSYLEMEPEEFVLQLSSEVDSEIDQSKFLWGFLTKADYGGIVKFITPYKDNLEFGYLVEKLLSDEGKSWVERVLELVKETVNE